MRQCGRGGEGRKVSYKVGRKEEAGAPDKAPHAVDRAPLPHSFRSISRTIDSAVVATLSGGFTCWTSFARLGEHIQGARNFVCAICGNLYSLPFLPLCGTIFKTYQSLNLWHHKCLAPAYHIRVPYTSAHSCLYILFAKFSIIPLPSLYGSGSVTFGHHFVLFQIICTLSFSYITILLAQ